MKQEDIHAKGFKMNQQEFAKIKLGRNVFEDITMSGAYGSTKSVTRSYSDKAKVVKALTNNDLKELRAISRYFYRTSGIYSRICNYFAQMYRYDWYIAPELYGDKVSEKKLLADFKKALTFLDNSAIKQTCGEIALKVIMEGVYYACVMISPTGGIMLQELPVEYCRSLYNRGRTPIIDLDMKYFDAKFPDVVQRMKVLKLFPEDVQKGYVLYKSGKLPADSVNEKNSSWYTLQAGSAIKFDFGNGGTPVFASAIPALLDLEASQELDRRKQMQKLLKILVQTLPTDKNGDLIFDIDEANDIHKNAVAMLSNAVGVDVLTTFADIEAINIQDNATAASNDELEKVERQLYNAFGTAQNLFNAEGNLATTNSILNDESMCRNLLYQFSNFYNQVTQLLSTNKKYNFRFWMLETTQYNYKELSKMYKEQMNNGYSKMLPQIALGHSQSFILNSCHFENVLLELYKVMIPPVSTNTINGEELLGRGDNSNTGNSQNNVEGNGEAGRPEKEDGEKSDKTIANQESMN